MRPLNQATQYLNQPGPMPWGCVPDFIQTVLKDQGCTLLRHRRQWPQLKHIRFQFAPLAYEGDLYFLQRWSQHEWGVTPSQIIFPMEGPCLPKLLSNGSLLSEAVKRAVAIAYGDFPSDSPFQPSPSTRRYTHIKRFPLAG